MIYTPQKNPKEAMLLISIIVLAGILLGFFVHRLFIVAALLFWMQYTAILSYLQFKKKRKYEWKSFTHFLLNPEFRFFIFEFLAVLGILAVVLYGRLDIGSLVLIAWWLFSLNFYRHYVQFRKYS